MKKLLLLVLFSLLVFRALADGCYIPARAVLKMPAIPAQQAIVTWKDGTETLVIASSLDSESQKLGWIIPLPSVPDTIEKATPGTLKTLAFALQPTITHDLYLECKMSVILLTVVLLLLATVLFYRQGFRDLLLLLAILFVLSAALFPAGMSASGGHAMARAAHVEKTVRVGAYAISILRSGHTDGLTQWLSANGFAPVPASAQKTVSDYIREGWVFAAIALSRQEHGANTPHPIRMTFKTEKPVYPMRLTALAGGSTDLDLFVIADQQASCDTLQRSFCDQFISSTNTDKNVETPTSYHGKNSNLALGHPAFCDLMWKDCIVTKLSGQIPAQEMTKDLYFGWTPFKPFRQHLYTRAGAIASSFLVCLWGLGGMLCVAMILYGTGMREPNGGRRFFKKIMRPASLVILLVATARYAVIPKMEGGDFHVVRFRTHFYTGWRMNSIKSAFKYDPSLMKGSEDEIAKRLLSQIEAQEQNGGKAFKYKGNLVAGGPLQIEDSPGNFTVQKTEDAVIVRVYDEAGRPEAEKFH